MNIEPINGHGSGRRPPLHEVRVGGPAVVPAPKAPAPRRVRVEAPSLVDARPHLEDGGPMWLNRSHGATSGPVACHFGDIKTPLLRFIDGAEVIVGCVAWLTDEDVLAALAVPEVALVVQKEDFLRPDLGARGSWKLRLRTAYEQLHNDLFRPNDVGPLSYAWDPEVTPVRCAGNQNFDRRPTMPRMHHKFVVRCHWETDPPDDLQPWGVRTLVADAVWTGSFNFTRNGDRSLENTVEIHDPVIAAAYLEEWRRVEAISEPLDWTAVWSEPEWRIGT